MNRISRNDPCPCGSGKKYKKCCLEKKASESALPRIPEDSELTAAALRISGENYTPAIVCLDEASHECHFVLARASRPYSALEAAEEADLDLFSSSTSEKHGTNPDLQSYLGTIGYKVVEGAGLDAVELLDDLESDDEGFERTAEMLLDVAETQVRRRDPPEVRQTLVRLRRLGHSRDEAMEMIVAAMIQESVVSSQEGCEPSEPNIDRYVASLARLPELPELDSMMNAAKPAEVPPVSLRAVINEMDVISEEHTAYLNKRTGELMTFSQDELAAAEEDEDGESSLDWDETILKKAREALESEDYLELPSKFDIHEYSIMENFCESLPDGQSSERLLRAIRGSGAFRRFKNAIRQFNIQEDWYRFRDKAFERIAIEWLEENGVPYVRDTVKNIGL